MYCTKCGEKIQDGSKFCAKCGQPVEQIPAGAAETPVTAQTD